MMSQYGHSVTGKTMNAACRHSPLVSFSDQSYLSSYVQARVHHARAAVRSGAGHGGTQVHATAV